MRIRALAGLALTFSLLGTGTALGAVSGDLDNSFSGDGRLATEFNSANLTDTRDAVVDSSGRLVVVGQDGSEIGVARFNPNGSFDTTFGGDGDITIDSGATSGGETATAVSIDPATGNILVLGEAAIAATGDTSDLVLARVQPGGAPDNTFDGPGAMPGNGVFRLDFDDTEAGRDIIPNADKVVFTAQKGTGTARVVKIVQLTSTGALDTASFGNPNGFFDFQWAASTDSFADGLAQQGDGKFIVSGSINGTATYGVARINTNGSLDTTFNSGGTIPGILRPPLPMGYIESKARDVVVDANGITVAGFARRGSPSFDYEAMLSRVTSLGAPDNTFGTSASFATVPVPGADTEVFTGITSLADGKLFVGGTGGPSGAFTQLAARFTSTGALDAGFSGDGILETGHPGLASVTGIASPLSAAGVAYLTGVGTGSVIAITAVCVTVPPACPSPETPNVQMVTPPSGSNDNNPRVLGTVPAGGPVTSVNIYRDAACTPPAIGSGNQALFETTGVPASVPDNSTSTLYAQAAGPHGTSPCSTTFVTYSEVTPPVIPSTTPVTPTQPAPKKCKKGFVKKKGKCKRKKRRK